MADEIRITAGLTVEKSNLKLNIPSRTTVATMAGSRFIRNCQAVGTTYEAVVVGDVSTAGVGLFTNLDTTNYVELGVEVAAAFYPVVRLLAGETYCFRLSVLTLFAKANTSPVNCDICICEA